MHCIPHTLGNLHLHGWRPTESSALKGPPQKLGVSSGSLEPPLSPPEPPCISQIPSPPQCHTAPIITSPEALCSSPSSVTPTTACLRARSLPRVHPCSPPQRLIPSLTCSTCPQEPEHSPTQCCQWPRHLGYLPRRQAQRGRTVPRPSQTDRGPRAQRPSPALPGSWWAQGIAQPQPLLPGNLSAPPLSSPTRGRCPQSPSLLPPCISSLFLSHSASAPPASQPQQPPLPLHGATAASALGSTSGTSGRKARGQDRQRR